MSSKVERNGKKGTLEEEEYCGDWVGATLAYVIHPLFPWKLPLLYDGDSDKATWMS